MLSIHVLTPFLSPNSIAIFLPLKRFGKQIGERGITCRFFHRADDGFGHADIAIVDSKHFRDVSDEDEKDAQFKFLEAVRRRSNASLWFDTTDGSGSTQFEVLPYVSAYYKTCLLRDKTLYLSKWYGDRIYCDYLHREYGVEDRVPNVQNATPCQGDLDRIQVGWNTYMGDYGSLRRYRLAFRRLTGSSIAYWVRFTMPRSIRYGGVTCRVNTAYGRETIRHHRQRIVSLLSREFGLSTDRLSLGRYFAELGKSRVCVSPFGWGEIAFRDFEAFMSGCALLKPDMEHMETWPPLYRSDETYVAFKWNCEDLIAKAEHMLAADGWLRIAAAALESYQEVVSGCSAADMFCRRIVEVAKRHVCFAA